MSTKHLRVLYPILIIGTSIAIALSTASARVHADSSAHIKSAHEAASFLQVVTPTPTPTAAPVSKAGSTDGIMLMGAIIVLIILLPILLNRSTWKK